MIHYIEDVKRLIMLVLMHLYLYTSTALMAVLTARKCMRLVLEVEVLLNQS